MYLAGVMAAARNVPDIARKSGDTNIKGSDLSGPTVLFLILWYNTVVPETSQSSLYYMQSIEPLYYKIELWTFLTNSLPLFPQFLL